jgi:hypothetical protein
VRKIKHEIQDYLDAQLAIIHDLRKEGVSANGVYIRESPVPVSAITREWVQGRLCGPSLQDSVGQLQHGARNGVVPTGTEATLLEAVRGGKRPKSSAKALLVDIEAIHEGLTKNMTFYPVSNLELSAKTWTEPYEKPVITHHRNQDFFTQADDPIGRVIAYEFKDSVINPGKKTISIRQRITNPESQEKIIDGRYLTTSIGAIASSLHCSICGVNLLETWCDHRRGKKYSIKKDEDSPEEQKLAYWIVGPMWFEEDSFVNTPADESAQVTHFEWEADVGNGRSESRIMKPTEILNSMDEILADPVIEDNKAPEIPEVPAVVVEGELPAEGNVADPVVELVTESTTEEKLTAAQAQIAELQAKVDAAEADATSARQEAVEATAAKVAAQQELAVANVENKQLMERAKSFASQGRRILVDRVIDLKIATNEAKEEDRQSLSDSFAGKKPSELAEMAQAALAAKPARVIAQVTNPGQIAADGEVIEGNTNGGATKELSIDQMADALVRAMSMRNEEPTR